MLFAVAALAGVGRPAPAIGAGAASTTQPSLVTTNGHGDVTAVPDEAVISAGVNTHGATAAAALSQNARLMQQVIAALKNAGGSDLRTQEVSLNPQTNDQGNVTGYVAQDTVSAKARIAAAGALIDAAVGAGANTVDGPASTSPTATRSTATRSSTRSRTLVPRHRRSPRRAGSTVGPVFSVSEGSAAPQPLDRAAAAPAVAAPTPVEPGRRT